MSHIAVDFLLITALEQELLALLDCLPAHQKLDPIAEDIHTYYEATIAGTLPSGREISYRVIAAGIMHMGRVDAATFTSAAIQRWKPRFVILIGIAGGIPESGVALGDVLVSDQIVDYELQKQYSLNNRVSYEVHRTDPRLLGAAINFIHEWIPTALNRPVTGTPRVLVGPIATGDKVVARKALIDAYREDWPKLIGVEMESGGVANAAYQSASRPGFFMVRGVSDFADEKKDTAEVTDWRQYACNVAANFAVNLIQSGPVPTASNAEPPELNLDNVVRRTLAVDLSTAEVTRKIEADIAIEKQDEIFGSRGLCAAYRLTPRPNNCFLAADVREHDDLSQALSLAFREFEITAIKASDMIIPGALLCKIAGLIRETRFGVYAMNPTDDRNVYLQLGIAIGLGRPFLLLRHRDVVPSRLASALDYYPVDSYLELRFGLSHSVRNVILSMTHYQPFFAKPTESTNRVFVEHGDLNEVDFAYAVAVSLNRAGLEPVFGKLENTAADILERAQLKFHTLEEIATNQLNQTIAEMNASRSTIIRIDERASPDAALTLGIALAQNHHVILVHDQSASIPETIRGLNRIAFHSFSELSTKLDRFFQDANRH